MLTRRKRLPRPWAGCWTDKRAAEWWPEWRSGLLCLATVLGLLVSSPAEAEAYPEHGFFQVRSGIDVDHVRYCQLRAAADADDDPFALTMRWYPAGSLQVWFTSGDEVVSQEGATVYIVIDDKRILSFMPAQQSRDDGLNTVTSRVMRRVVGLPVEAMLSDAAFNAAWLQVRTTAPYAASISAAGMAEALQDLHACRMSLDL